MTESQINVHGISPNAVNDIGPNDFVNNYHLEDVIRHEERQYSHNQKMRIREGDKEAKFIRKLELEVGAYDLSWENTPKFNPTGCNAEKRKEKLKNTVLKLAVDQGKKTWKSMKYHGKIDPGPGTYWWDFHKTSRRLGSTRKLRMSRYTGSHFPGGMRNLKNWTNVVEKPCGAGKAKRSCDLSKHFTHKEIIDMWQKLTQQEIDDFNPYGDYDFLNNINSNSENDSTITQVSDSSTNNILATTTTTSTSKNNKRKRDDESTEEEEEEVVVELSAGEKFDDTDIGDNRNAMQKSPAQWKNHNLFKGITSDGAPTTVTARPAAKRQDTNMDKFDALFNKLGNKYLPYKKKLIEEGYDGIPELKACKIQELMSERIGMKRGHANLLITELEKIENYNILYV